jgi:hypothetical protein
MDNSDKLVSSPEAQVGLLLEEYQQASPLGEGLFDANFCENVRRNLWPGQSPDGRKWDEWQPDGEPAQPWDGASDTRIPAVDGAINDAVALGLAAFRRAELRVETVNPALAPLQGPLEAWGHWMTKRRYRKQLELEAELALQYCGEYGYCVAYVGWERELSKRRQMVTLEELAALAQQAPEFQGLAQMILESPDLDEQSAEMIRELYRQYVGQQMSGKGFYEEELEDTKLLDLHLSTAKRYVRELREKGKVEVPMPYVCKNQPLVYMARPYHEFLCARGTTAIESSRVLFLRRTFTESELAAKEQDGWYPAFIEAAKKTKGSLSMWGNPSGQPTIAPTNMSPAKVVGGVRWYKLTQQQYERIEIVYAFRRNTDENGVTEIYQTIFSPHLTHDDKGGADFCAKHELVDYAHGQYPFVVLKRENLGRGLTESRSVSEIGGTWQAEEKAQRDMLFNRAQLDTLPPISVPKLGGVDYRIGPGAQVPVKRGDEFAKLFELGAPPQLAMELLAMIHTQRAAYFGLFDAGVPQPSTSSKQEKASGDFFLFWSEILLHMTCLTLQYHPQELVTVTGTPELAQVDPFELMQSVQFGLAFDMMELDQEYLMKKLEIIAAKILPLDVTGTIDRNALIALAVRMIDSRLADKILLDKGAASQKVYDDVMEQTLKMAGGNEAQYADNDATAPMKMQFLQQIVANNPKYQQLMQQDVRFVELMGNYAKSLQLSIDQQQNKQVGRIGVKPMTGAPQKG